MKQSKQKYKELFDVTGFFYRKNGRDFRKFLNIKKKGINKARPDVMVVMMNPGGSEPEAGFSKETYDKEVVTVPDRTQYHIMELMRKKNWEYARIVNLSDVCQKDSGKFYKWIRGLGNKQLNHSFFDETRKSDFDEFFEEKIPVIVAWGVNNTLNDLSKMAIERLKPRKIVGLKKKEFDWKFYHPMMRIKEPENTWVEQMLVEMKIILNDKRHVHY